MPLAHQSALAGILLTARLVADASGHRRNEATQITRINVLRPLGQDLVQPAAKDPRGICICQDVVYQRAYQAKWQGDAGT